MTVHPQEMDEALQSSEETSFKEMASAHNKFKQQDLETEDRDAWKYRHQQSRYIASCIGFTNRL